MASPGSALADSPDCSACSLETALQNIFTETPAAVRLREQRCVTDMLAACANRCVVFGAGSMGRRSVAALRSIGVEPLALSDNNPQLWGHAIDGVSVLPPSEAAAAFGPDAHFFIAIRNEAHWYRETEQQLRAVGCLHVSCAEPVAWRFPEIFQPFLPYDLPHKVYEQAAKVQHAARLWADDASRAEYLAQVRLRAQGDPSGLGPPVPESYVLDGVFDVRTEDTLVDCGAFDGDTMRDWMQRQPAFDRIEAIEADSHSFARLAQYAASLPPHVHNRIRLHNCAVGSFCGTARFEDSGKVDSKISPDGAVVVDMVPIDTMFQRKPVSMIKMDIEGGEFDALMGAAHVIRRDRPILAVCVYHSQSDLWRLPLLIHSMNPDYRMYLKAYSGDGIQTVAYAVPPERVLN